MLKFTMKISQERVDGKTYIRVILCNTLYIYTLYIHTYLSKTLLSHGNKFATIEQKSDTCIHHERKNEEARGKKVWKYVSIYIDFGTNQYV